MLKRIADNANLRIRVGEQMDSRLVFLGAVPTSAKSVPLILNEGNDWSATSGPGVDISLLAIRLVSNFAGKFSELCSYGGDLPTMR